jgi:hypothetical protein
MRSDHQEALTEIMMPTRCEWRAESDGVAELVVFCPECWQREFGSSE